ncbi:MAG TPA: prephenate dehydrogenase/arogenate dehydrogenase family protein [Bryobacteraceae bacterium]|nr:prephenate dehydrogenase/arogenate dehydrogenase family protein [Bryobacteraceae bacterium]
MDSVAIVGVGLIGGSFGLALREAGYTGPILGVSSEGAIAEAVERGAIDRGVNLDEAVQFASVLYLAQPISKILQVIPELSRARPGTLVTDAGSTKVTITEKARNFVRGAQFLGGHPMAGKETRGVGSAEAALFRGRTYFLTPREVAELDTPAASSFVSWLKRIGANVVPISPAAHDHLVAHTSHLPQLLSTSLAVALSESLGAAARTGAGPGLMDMTRLAMSSFEIWDDILRTNNKEIDGALAMMQRTLEQMRARLGNDSMRDPFEIADIFSKSLRNTRL